MIIIISGPSGVGKTTICNKLVSNIKNLAYSVSATTREKRKNEVNGEDYLFLSEEKFHKWEKEDKFLETAEVYGDMYGTLKENIYNLMQDGKDVIMDLDIKGALNIKDKIEDTVSIFLLPPDENETKKRLFKRGADTKETISKRIRNAREEIKSAEKFDYVVINDDIKECVDLIKSIIIIEKKRNLYGGVE